MIRFVRVTLVTCAMLFAGSALAQETAKSSEVSAPHSEEFATMRDGVQLAANVFKPAGVGPWPVVLSRTPYLKDGRMGSGASQKYTDAGFVFVLQDVRGKGHSQGEYRPFVNDRNDGFDSVAWAAKQPWSNGKIGMTGASALGMTTNLAASTNPPALKAAYVIVAPHSQFYEVTFMGGVFKQGDTGNWMEQQGAGAQVPPLKRRVIWDNEWQANDFASHIDEVHVPMYNVGGWYDIFNIGNLRNFAYLQNHGARGAKGNQKLAMGPFGHGPLSGDLEYPNAPKPPDDEIRWFDYWLKGVDNGIMKEPPVRYYRMAAAEKGKFSDKNVWLTAKNWPLSSRATAYYLHEGLTLSPDKPREKSASKSYRFDPAHPAPTVGGANLTFARGPMDERKIGEREDYLRFATPALTQDVAITGPVHAKLWVATDGPDTDFIAKLVDVYPDGYEAIVLDAPVRLRYRHGRKKASQTKMMTPGKPAEVEVDLWATSLVFEQGHRIAVHVTSSSTPRFEVNDNNGTPAGEPPHNRVAVNTIYFDRAHPSEIILPVVGE